MLRFAVVAPTTLDPALAGDPESVSLAELTSTPLTVLDPASSLAGPGLARSWSADATQQTIRDTRRASATFGDLERASINYRRIQQRSTAGNDTRQLFRGIKLQTRNNTKTIAQGVGQHARACGGTHQRERLQIKPH